MLNMFGTNMETRVSGAKVVKRKRVIHNKSLLFDHNINTNAERLCEVSILTEFTIKSQLPIKL